ncbi:MAG: universal stress protein [Pseudomonadales bacterium]|nr:universal stress protein [Pseudomonadales bacterium]MCP5356660.1 universal stress protein [Pseudomonadales bacterium]
MSNYKHVMVAIDGSDESARIISTAWALADGAKISVVQVFDALVGNYSYELNMGDFQTVQREFEEAVAKNTRAMLKDKFPGISAESVHFLRGKPADEIKRLAKSSGVDLLVIGSHAQGALKAAVLGSTANAVLHGIHCDVFTVRV